MAMPFRPENKLIPLPHSVPIVVSLAPPKGAPGLAEFVERVSRSYGLWCQTTCLGKSDL